LLRKKIERHGHTPGNGKPSPTYSSWRAMRRRCNEPTNRKFHRYGAKGIRVCKRWCSFVSFLADMGERPLGKTLGRFRDKGNYTPSNCTWMTRAEQELEKQKNRTTHCKRGHLRIPENTNPVYPRYLHGTCRLCSNENMARYQKEKKSK
jgi:hypothetical protein